MKTIAFASQKGGAASPPWRRICRSWRTKARSPPSLSISTLRAHSPSGIASEQTRPPILVQTNHRELKAVLDEARAEGIDWAFVDGPPHDSAAIAEMMRLADLVIIPTRPSAFDLAAVASTLTMATALNANHLCVLNSVPPRRGFGHASVTTEARGVLSNLGGRVWSDAIVQRAVLAHAVAGGLAVGEMEPDGASDREMRPLGRRSEDCGGLEMKNRTSLGSLSGRLAQKPTAAPAEATPSVAEDAVQERKKRGSQLDGRKGVLLRLKPEAWLQLKGMAAQMTLEKDEMFTMQQALEDAVNDWFKKHGKPPLA